MLSGEGPLVDVLPDGQTIDEIMEEAADGEEDGEAVISFGSFWKYLCRPPKASEDQDSDVMDSPISYRRNSDRTTSIQFDDVVSEITVAEADSLERRQWQQVAVESMCKELDATDAGEEEVFQ